jgi:hypothetical protein
MSHRALAGKHCSIISDVQYLVDDDEWERTAKEGIATWLWYFPGIFQVAIRRRMLPLQQRHRCHLVLQKV